ncbi:hypothetical protein BDV96DRAFT_484852 [Lophiotrema nucula]|uniref:HMG box domain-containing protein n=1 Tax=Lophiotrema nucula TaxID=690887 RepID=A0A6A5ZME1_9PLEO|nr:hypothetical protein BDV96DRAFT_484852 [Lophiotrema nucula]
MFSGSPPTPRSATENDDAGRRTRSGRTVAPSSSPAAADKPRLKATPKKKAKAGKGEKLKTLKLTAPLSIMTKDMASIPVRNMEEWVNRSVEVRHQEVEKRNGYVTRPMNSFMLYRSAYSERTKQWCSQNNHQIVSSVSGESWPMEPPEVRELYNEYAKIERINHQNAHPTYKFSPSKSNPAPAKKRKEEFSDEEPSDLEDGEWNPGHRGSRVRTMSRTDRHLSYPASNISTEYLDRTYSHGGNGLTHLSWDMASQGRPMPMQIHMPMPQGDMYPQFFQTSIHPSMAMAPNVMDDMRMHRVDTPASSMHFSASHSLLGLPGGHVAEMLQHLHPSQAGTPLGEEGQVDPMLLAYEGGHQHELKPTMVQHPEFRNGHLTELDQESVHSLIHPHDDFHTDAWHSDPAIASLEQGSEFDKWMDEHAQ